MFGLDPFNRPVAIAEILLLLAFAALVGWLLGRLILASRINALRSAVADKEAELDECRRARFVMPPARSPVGVADKRSVDAIEAPPVFVATGPTVPVTDSESEIMADDSPTTLNMPVVEVPPMGAPIPEAMAIVPPVAAPAESAAPVPDLVNSEAAVLSRIAARAGELNFDRIGRATAAEADDLKDIVGVGPFLERKLHSLGIYTFRQVANFTKEDIDKVNEIIEFFPGRIERDNWVEQSQAFYERKYGRRDTE